MARQERDADQRSFSDPNDPDEEEQAEEDSGFRMRQSRPAAPAETREASSNSSAADDENDENRQGTLADDWRLSNQQRHRPANQNHNHKHNHAHHHRQLHNPPHHRHHREHGPQCQRNKPKEIIKPDPTVRRASVVRVISPSRSVVSSSTSGSLGRPGSSPQRVVATVVGEEQLHKRLVESQSDRSQREPKPAAPPGSLRQLNRRSPKTHRNNNHNHKTASASSSLSSSSSSSSSSSGGANREDDSGGVRSPPAAAIVIPPDVAESLSSKRHLGAPLSAGRSSTQKGAASQSSGSSSNGPILSREQLEYGQVLKSGEVQVLYRSPNPDTNEAGGSLSFPISRPRSSDLIANPQIISRPLPMQIDA